VLIVYVCLSEDNKILLRPLMMAGVRTSDNIYFNLNCHLPLVLQCFICISMLFITSVMFRLCLGFVILVMFNVLCIGLLCP
jgi:hypothetical protein